MLRQLAPLVDKHHKVAKMSLSAVQGGLLRRHRVDLQTVYCFLPHFLVWLFFITPVLFYFCFPTFYSLLAFYLMLLIVLLVPI